MSLVKRDSEQARRAALFQSVMASPSCDKQSRTPDLNAAASDPSAAMPDELAMRKSQLADRIAELEAALVAAADERDSACAAALARGRAEGMAAAESREAERSEALKVALADIQASLERRIGEERDLAIDIARAALDRLFGDPALYRGMVEETARRHAASLARGTIVALRVSASDFPDPAALAALPSLGNQVRVEADPNLDSGACIFDLSLGSLDASLSHQAAVIEAVFDQSLPGRSAPRAVSA